MMALSAGHSILPVDDYFESRYSIYVSIRKDLTELSTHCRHVLKNMKSWSMTNLKLSSNLHKYIEEVKGFENEVLREFCDNVTDLDNYYQNEYNKTWRAVSTVLNYRVIKQIDEFVKQGSEGIDSLYRERKNIRLDYDSHLQRVEVYRRKRNDAQMNRFKAKAEHDKQMLDQFDSYLLSHFEEFTSVGSVILMECSAAIVMSQVYIVKAQFDGLSEVGNNIGEQYTDSVLSDITEVLEGVENGSDVEKAFHPALHVFTFHSDHTVPKYIPFHEYEEGSLGKSLPVESISNGEESETDSTSVSDVDDVDQEEERYSFADWSSSEEGPYASDYEERSLFQVVAVYNFRSDEEGDLPFRKGDVITVTLVDKSGWWTGELNGKVGIFPANYVERL